MWLVGEVSRRRVWLVGVVVTRYIDFLILLIPTPLVSVLFAEASLLFVHFYNIRISKYPPNVIFRNANI